MLQKENELSIELKKVEEGNPMKQKEANNREKWMSEQQNRQLQDLYLGGP